LASSILRMLALRISPVSRLRWLSSTNETMPEKNNRHTMLRKPTVTLLRKPVILLMNFVVANIMI